MFSLLYHIFTQMIPIYDYYGLIVSFGKEAQLPIIVSGSRSEKKSSVSINFSNGLMEISEFLPENNELDETDQSDFKLLVENNSSEIIKLWLDVFLYGKKVQCEILKQKISK